MTVSDAGGIASAVDETAVVRRYSGSVGWPTVALCAGLVAADALVVFGWAVGSLPLWLGCVLNTWISYAFYTVHHDANHKAISGRAERWRWLDPVCGSIAAVPLQLSFRGFSSEHLRHHAHTNDPLRDPDAIVAGPFWQVPVKWFATIVISLLYTLPRGERLVDRILERVLPDGFPEPTERIRLENRRLQRFFRLGTVALLASIPLGWFLPVFFLWWLPGRLALLVLMALFQWLPHFPYESTERFLNTRITTFRGSTWLLFQQDRHLIHHLYPSVPWYRYRAVYREVRPLLVQHHARIEGRDADAPRPILLRSEAP